MTDLTKEFFERDLIEAEEQFLADEIASSPDAALRLADRAREAYEATGLPVPEWGRTATAGPSVGSGLLKCALVGALVAGGAWFWLSHRKAADPESTEAPAAVVTTAAEPAPAPARPATRKEAAPVPSAPTVAPQRFVPGRKYDGLSVIVDQPSVGLVTVRALDEAGRERRLLFAGLLPTGVWTFEWDGRLQDGTPAPEGIYRVETQSGKIVLQRNFQIVRP